jgi:putative RNA 2'-phosphotransferase
MQVTRIFETVIYAADLAAAERFYHVVLGLEVYSRSETVVSFRLAGGVLLVFDPGRASQPNRGVPSHGAQGPGHLAFSVAPASLEHWRAHLATHNVPIEMEVNWEQGGTSIYFRDPAGNSVELAPLTLWGGRWERPKRDAGGYGVVRVSKFLSRVLRHAPESIGLTLDPQGWAGVDELLDGAKRAGVPLTPELLQQVVAENDKQRFTLSADGRRIRANQGHSIPVDLGLEPRQPPAQLYHGTADRFVADIRRDGLSPRRRNHVHLSPDEATATRVGARHGRPVVLVIEAALMHDAGHTFYLSDNGVWLTDRVPPEFINQGQGELP